MRSRNVRNLLFIGSVLLITVLLFSSSTVRAQSVDEWFGDENIKMYLAINGVSITQATESNPIVVDLEGPTTILLKVNLTGTRAVYNLTGTIGFYYQGIKLFTILIAQNETKEIDPGVAFPPVEAQLNLGEILSAKSAGLPLDLATGLFQASVDLNYYLAGEDYSGPPPHSFGTDFYLLLPADNLIDVITSVAGITTTAATAGAVIGVGGQFKSLFEGIQTAHKIRSIQKKASELKSLPNLTVIGALPVLFSILAGLTKKVKRKKTTEEEPTAVSEYRLRQRLREVAPSVWPMDKCPKCGRDWNRKTTFCKKCKINAEQAKKAYAELLISKVPRAIKSLGKKKALSIRKLAQRTKSNQYNAGVIGAAMVDVGLAEITKVETPIRSFATNVAGLAFLVITWQQLLGGASSQWQTTLTIIGAAFSIAVIIALYFARKAQIERLRLEMAEHAPPEQPEPEETSPTPDESEKTEPETAEKEPSNGSGVPATAEEVQPNEDSQEKPSPEETGESRPETTE